MKNLLAVLILTISANSFAFTDAEIMRAAFDDKEFFKLIADRTIDSVNVVNVGYYHRVTINQENIQSGDCYLEAELGAQRYAIDYVTTGIKLKVFSIMDSCEE